jgi:hypothetical protein
VIWAEPAAAGCIHHHCGLPPAPVLAGGKGSGIPFFIKSSPLSEKHVSLEACFSGGVGGTEAMALQGNNFSRLFSFSGGDLLRRQRGGRGDLVRSPRLVHLHLLQVMLLLTLLISRKMFSDGNLTILWSLALASNDDWEATSAAISRKMNGGFELLCNVSFLWDPIC